MLSGDRTSKVTSTRGYITMALTDVDQELLYENYDVSLYEYVRGWKFAQKSDIFTDYVDRWYSLKTVSKGAARKVSKNMLNSLVGKFGTVPRDTELRPEWDDESQAVVWQIRKTSRMSSRNFLPIAMYVNAYARKTLMQACRQNSNIVSINTDGFIKLGNDVHGIQIDQTRRGRWKIKDRYKKIVIIDTGMYQGETEDGKFKLVCAGVTRSTPIPWEDFRVGGHFKDDYGTDIVIQ